MVVKVYISGISGNKEVKKRQQRVLMILDSKIIKYDVIDITEPGREDDKDFMQNNSKSNGATVSDPNPRSPLPPQLFNDDEYCGDYDQFDMANEIDTLEQFLKVEAPPEEPPQAENGPVNGDASLQNQDTKSSKENSQERNLADSDKSKEASPEKEGTPAKESKEGTPVKEGTPSKESTPVREPTPAKEGIAKESSPEKEASPEKESSPERQKSKSPAKDAKSSKEGTPEVKESLNENGAVSSREQSVEKAESEVTKKDDPSEALIESEQATAAE